MINFDIKSRWTRAIKFTASIDCAEDAPLRVKIGLSVKCAVENKADLRDADLRDADLRDADLRDADLRYADLRYADLRDANLSYANLSGANLSGADLSDAILIGANLSYANLSDADLRYADLRYADLRNANLSDAPKIENIHQKIYAAASVDGALDMGSWHKCETTHCRAGWAVTLAGEDGLALEKRIGTAAAGALIYLASDTTLERIPNWYASNEDALEDMRKLAEAEAARGAP